MPAWTISVGGINRKYKTVEINRKVRMDSPPEFTATIEYGSDVNFNNTVVIQRDGKTEWKGFVEDIEIDWDENGRYLNIGGRDITLLIWRKYVENFANMIEGTGGFFGNVSASELIKFLLRTPRSDLPTDANGKTIYPFNKEGWGIDTSKINSLTAENTSYGDINWTTLRRRGLGWRNSGDPYAVATKTVDAVIGTPTWELFGTTPYLNTNDDINYIHSDGVDEYAEFSFANLGGAEDASSIYGCKLVVYYRPDTTYWTWINSDCWVYIWVASTSSWVYIGDFGGRAPPWNNPWRKIEFDLFYILKTVSDVNATKVKFVEKGSLGTNITSAALDIGYVGQGSQTTNEFVEVAFNEEEIMGVYVESRNSAEMYPRNYKITCRGSEEPFTGYTEVDPNNHLSLSTDEKTLTFDSYQNELAYFYKDYGASPLEDIDESFSFEVDTPQSSPHAFIPWCLANNIEGYSSLLGNASHYFTAFEIKYDFGQLSIRAALQDSGGLAYTSYYDIDASTRYFARVDRVGAALRYRLWDNSDMTGTPIMDEPFTSDECTFQYRYQAITYNGLEWAGVFDEKMDSYYSGSGEQIVNGGFETGDDTGWHNIGGHVQNTEHHSGSWAINMYTTNDQISQTDDFSPAIPEDALTSLGFWYKGTNGKEFHSFLYYTDVYYTRVITICTDTSWHYLNLLPSFRTGGHLRNILISVIGSSTFWVDDVTVFVTSQTNWSRSDATSGGAATRSDEVTIIAPYADNLGSQKIHGTANNTGYYFEKDLSASDEEKVDAWVRVPEPLSEGVDEDRDIISMDLNGGQVYEWATHGIGTEPTLLATDDGDTSYIWSHVLDSSLDVQYKNQWYFEQIHSKYGSFAPDVSGCELRLKARLFDEGSGTCTSVDVYVDLYIKSQGGWTTLGHGTCNSTSWQGWIFNIGPSSFIQNLEDLRLLKMRLYIKDRVGPNTGQIRITWSYTHVKGTGYMGTINLMKLYNNAIAGGPNPSSGWIAGVAVELDNTATSYIGSWRWKVDGFTGTGIWTSDYSSAIAANDTWYHLRLYAKRDSAGGYTGYFKLYDITSGSEVWLCECTGLNNINYGSMDRYEFEVEYGTYNGSGQDAYLDWTYIQAKVASHSNGFVYSGYGPDVTLVNVVNNTYKDIIHSWKPRVMTNLKIVITSNDDDHGWEITQIYIYKTDPIKYRVVLDAGETQPIAKLLTFTSGSYVTCTDADIGKQVWIYNLGEVVGDLVSYDNDKYEWRVNTTSTLMVSGYEACLSDRYGIDYLELSVNPVSCYAGGPYITIGDELDPLNIGTVFEYSVPLEPMNIGKNRLFDVLWDLSIAICDTNFMPYEWWTDYDTNNTFHIGSRRGYDKHTTVSFILGTNLEGTKYQKSSRDCYQRCEVIGQGEGSSQDKSSSFWTSDEDAMDIVNGFIEDIVTQKQISNPMLANRYAKVKLKLDASPTGKNSIDCHISKDTYASFDYTDPSATDTYNVGDDVTITDFLTNINGSFRIWNSKTVIEESGEKPTLTIQAPLLDIKNIWKEIWKELKNVGIVGGIVQDWAGQGTQSSKMAAEKITSLFDVTGKNEETDAENKGSTKWWETPSPDKDADWDAENQNLVIFGGTGGIGEIEVEARYEPITGSPDGAVALPVDISMKQEPKFTCEFTIWEPDSIQSPSGWSNWVNGDRAEFGIFNCETTNGFKFRIKKESSNFILYAVYDVKHLADTNATEIERKICNLTTSTRATVGYFTKYKVEIITDFSEPISSVTFNVYNETENWDTPISAVFTKIEDLSVRPIYVHAYGDGTSANTRCIIHFYNLKCERQVMP